MGEVVSTVTDVRYCMWCGGESRIRVDKAKWSRWMRGEYAQNVWPEWSDEERELLISGTHAACWDELMGGED